MRNRKNIKLNVNMYDDTKLKVIDTKPERDLIHYIWTRILILAGKVNLDGDLYMSKNIPFTLETLAIEFNREAFRIKNAIDVLIDLEMIEITENNVYRVKNFTKHQNVRKKVQANRSEGHLEEQEKVIKKAAGNEANSKETEINKEKNEEININANINTNAEIEEELLKSTAIESLNGVSVQGIEKKVDIGNNECSLIKDENLKRTGGKPVCDEVKHEEEKDNSKGIVNNNEILECSSAANITELRPKRKRSIRKNKKKDKEGLSDIDIFEVEDEEEDICTIYDGIKPLEEGSTIISSITFDGDKMIDNTLSEKARLRM